MILVKLMFLFKLSLWNILI
jgi:hypothetical protein